MHAALTIRLLTNRNSYSAIWSGYPRARVWERSEVYATATPAAVLVPLAPAFAEPERLALAGFLASCTGLTGEACTLDLR